MYYSTNQSENIPQIKVKTQFKVVWQFYKSHPQKSPRDLLAKGMMHAVLVKCRIFSNQFSPQVFFFQLSLAFKLQLFEDKIRDSQTAMNSAPAGSIIYKDSSTICKNFLLMGKDFSLVLQ